MGVQRTTDHRSRARQATEHAAGARGRGHHTAWTEQIPDEEWKIYFSAIQVLRETGRPFMLAGAFSLATYTGHWRNTKDLDFYVLPEDRDAMVNALTRAGFTDYFHQLPYVRHWIYRAWKNDCIVDIIWAMANQRAQVDAEWFARAPEVTVRGERLAVVPPEELLWCKLYVMQRDRCDWPDIINLVHCVGNELDWEHLVRRLEGDVPLLAGILNVYGWLCPGAPLLNLPPILNNMTISPSPNGHVCREDSFRIDLLDTRPWFRRPRNQS